MTDLDLNAEQVVLGGIEADCGYTHDSIQVTVSATLKQGSILDVDGNELALVAASDSVYVVDDLTVRRHLAEYSDGDTLLISVAARGLILNEDVCAFTDAGIDATGKAALATSMNKFSTPVVDTDLV